MPTDLYDEAADELMKIFMTIFELWQRATPSKTQSCCKNGVGRSFGRVGDPDRIRTNIVLISVYFLIMENDYPEDLELTANPVVVIEDYYNEVIVDGEPLYEVNKQEHASRLHKYIGAILAINKKKGGAPIKGSGVLISPDLVLTGAHNLWDRGGGENSTFKFYPGLCGPLKDSPCYDCSVVFYPKEHENCNEPMFDYGLLKLSEPILNKEDDFLPLSPSINGDLMAANQKRLAIYGYPKYLQVDSLGKE
jgi:V8-like Glu-specific endopeptidase